VPTIAEIDGTRIMMFPFDHDPPHIHVFAADFRAKLAISDARVLETRGTIGPAVMRRLRQWVCAIAGDWANSGPMCNLAIQ
jgi:hypothetical protein